MRPTERRSSIWGALLLLALATAACGKTGSPLAPLPRGPFSPRQVEVRQIGERVLVSFLVPPERRSGTTAQAVVAELVRVSCPPGPAPPVNADSFRRLGKTVAREVGDPFEVDARVELEDRTLDEFDRRAEGWTLRYGLRIRDRRSRPSPLVVTGDLVPLPPGPPPIGLRVEPTADGMRLNWSEPDGVDSATFNVYRADEAGAPSARPVNSTPLAQTDYLDATVVEGRRYTYTVRLVTDLGPPLHEGPPGESVTVLAEDLFAPAAPRGLIVVQEGAFVRLFWDPNAEPDLASYRVYRRVDGGEWRPVSSSDVDQPLYLDRQVDVDRRYTYRVTALDRATPPNESLPSATVELEVLADPSGDRP